MTTEDAFQQAIRENPDDDSPRLIFADWLDEHGRRERAEFIRVQCELARIDEGDDRYWPLRVRERLSLWGHGKGWAGPLRRLVKAYSFRRGFVERVTLSAEAFVRLGDALFRDAPVTEARLTDAVGQVKALAASPTLARLHGLDLRHTEGLTPTVLRPLLESANLRELRSLCLRGTGICGGPGLLALAACPRLEGLRRLDLGDMRADAAIGRQRWYRERKRQHQQWQARREAAAVGGSAMQALLRSPYLANLRSLSLPGYSTRIAQEALDALLGSALLAGLEELDLSWSMGPREGAEDRPGVIEQLRRSPQAAGLRTLRARKLGWYLARGSESRQPTPGLRGLRSLVLDDRPPSEQAWENLAGGCFPELTTLRLSGLTFWRKGAVAVLGRLAASENLPRLRTLDLHQTPLKEGLLGAFIDSPLLRRLRWLSLANRSGYNSTPLGAGPISELVRSPSVGNLVHLDLSNHGLDDAAAEALASSPHLGRLASLNLWHNRIGDAGALALARSDNLAALAVLDLRANPVNAPAVRRLLRERYGPGVRYGPGPMLAADVRALRRRLHPEDPDAEEPIPF